jgi:hypothetical protein
MELVWYCTGVFSVRQQSCWGFYGFSKGHELDGKIKKLTACPLIPHNKNSGS